MRFFYTWVHCLVRIFSDEPHRMSVVTFHSPKFVNGVIRIHFCECEGPGLEDWGVIKQ